MSDANIATLDFIATLANINATFRKLQILVSKSNMIKQTSISINPVKSDSTSEYSDYGVSISIAIDSVLVTPPDDEKNSIGASLLLRRPAGVWIAEAEIGWSGVSIGWDVFAAQEVQASSFDELSLRIPVLVEWLETRYKAEVEKLAS